MIERATRYAIYNCNYHLVWIPKYRKSFLIGDVKQELLNLFDSIAKSQEMEVLSSEVMPDHIHLFVSAPPRLSPAEIVNVFKGVTARMLRMKFPKLKSLVQDGLWTRTYYIGTAGTVSAETIKRYIEMQEMNEHKKQQKTKKG
jgi:putative transposase